MSALRYQSQFPQKEEYVYRLRADGVPERVSKRDFEFNQAFHNIIDAAVRGDREEVKRILAIPYDGYETGFTTNVPWFRVLDDGTEIDELNYSIAKGNLTMVKILVEQGAIPIKHSVETPSRDTLEIAAQHNRLDIIKFLWEASQNDYYRYVREGATADRDRYPNKGPLGNIGSAAVATAANLGHDDIVEYLVTVCGATIDYDYIRRGKFLRIINKYNPDVVRLFKLVVENNHESAIGLIMNGVSCDVFFPTDTMGKLVELGPRITTLGLALSDRRYPKEIIAAMIGAGANPFKKMTRAVSDPTLEYLYAAAMCCDERPVVLLAALGVQFSSEMVVSILKRPRTGRIAGERVRILTALQVSGVTIPESVFDDFPEFANELIKIGYLPIYRSF